MLFIVNECGNVKKFVVYFLNEIDNEYVIVYEVKGFVFDDVMGVFKEV